MKITKYAKNYCVASLFIFIYPIFGQVDTKKELTEEDYHKWTSLTREEISNLGNWVSYANRHIRKADTLIIQNMNTNTKFKITDGNKGVFSKNEKWFAALDKNRDIILIDLITEKKQVLHSESKSFEFSPNGNYFSVLSTDGLYLQNLNSGKNYNLKGVKVFKWIENKELLALVTAENTGQSVSLWNPEIETVPKQIIKNTTGNFDGLETDRHGSKLAFVEADASSNSLTEFKRLHILDIKRGSLITFDSETHKDFPVDRVIVKHSTAKLEFSDDGRKIQFSTILKSENESDSYEEANAADVQVWDAKAPFAYPRMQSLEAFMENPLLSYVWDFENDNLIQIGDISHPVALINSKQTHAITYSHFDYTPVFLHKEEYTDVYLMDLKTGDKKLFLEKQLLYNKVYASPEGAHFYYFRNGHWWVYEIKSAHHKNITKDIPYSFYQMEYDWAGTPPPYGVGGWTPGDNEILVYDKYDIWKINVTNNKKERLTKGRETHTSFQVYQMLYVNYRLFDKAVDQVDLNKDLVLKAHNHKTKDIGYWIRDKKGKTTQLAYSKSKSTKMRKADNSDVYIYLEESFELPPRLMVVDRKNNQTKTVFQSNSHAFDYNWGKATLVQYTNKSGDSLQGVLYYPAQYSSDKQYPMLVSVYEKQSHFLHDYWNPSLYNSDGFNIANFTSQGYFVFSPDIKFKLGDPGLSATDCVVSGVKAVLKKGKIHPDKMGLFGFSFGGYVTSFIITQTDIFNAAVTGSGANNLMGFYLTLGWNNGEPDLWRFERQQWRMGDSYFNMKSQYERNCPIQQASNINTPVMGFTGNKDIQVDWQQGVQFYIALRRLQKEHVFLLYTDEGHGILKPKNQIDLYNRIKTWFGSHLKVE